MDWKNCKRILVIRPDNMGDLLMSSPAIRAFKTSFKCHITLLTSSMAEEVAHLIPEIDDIIVFNLPWLKFEETQSSNELYQLISRLKSAQFDGCVLFNVFSQNPAPCIMLAYLAEIPLRAAICRENLYGLLTHWLPDEEPYFSIQHQVERDLLLANFIGADYLEDQRILIQENKKLSNQKLKNEYIIFHAGVSEEKRRFPLDNWIALGEAVLSEFSLPILLTGSQNDYENNEKICNALGNYSQNLAGKLTVAELTSCIKNAGVMVSVNTGPVHLAAAVNTPVLVLSARTNPQHNPWMVNSRIIYFDVPENLQSKNQVLRYVHQQYYSEKIYFPSTEFIMTQVKELFYQ